jgi:hypothetical protein
MEDVAKILPELKTLVTQITQAKAYYLGQMN